jgi:hypothetical protein
MGVSGQCHYRLDDRGLISGRVKDFSCSLCVQTSSETHPVSYTMRVEGKARPGRDADHSSPPSADVKNE